MKYRLNIIFCLGLLCLFVSSPVLARNCPSLLSGHLYELGEQFALGAELRAFYVGASVGDNLPSSYKEDSDFENAVKLALRPLINWYATDELTFVLEGEVRYIRPGWESKRITGLDVRLTQALVDYDASMFQATAGVQTLNFGTGAALDQRFLSLYTKYKHRAFSVAAFGGATSRNMMKNTVNCMWMHYASDNIRYKAVSGTLKNFIGGLQLQLKALRPYNFELLYYYAYPKVARLRSHVISLLATGPIVERLLSFVAEPLVLITNDTYVLPALVTELRLNLPQNLPRARVGAALSFRTEEHRTIIVYENLSWGLIRRFSLYNGNIFFAKVGWQVIKHVKPFVHYYFQTYDYSFEDSIDTDSRFVLYSDELDAGVHLDLGDQYRLKLSFVGINLAIPDVEPTYMVYAELRIIFGDQFMSGN